MKIARAQLKRTSPYSPSKFHETERFDRESEDDLAMASKSTPPAFSSADEYLTVAEASDILRTPIKTVYRWLQVGRLRYAKPGRRVLISRRELDRLLAGASR